MDPGRACRAPAQRNGSPLVETDVALPGTLAVVDGELIFGVEAAAGSPAELRAPHLGGSGDERVIRRGWTYDDLWIGVASGRSRS